MFPGLSATNKTLTISTSPKGDSAMPRPLDYHSKLRHKRQALEDKIHLLQLELRIVADELASLAPDEGPPRRRATDRMPDKRAS